MTKSLKAFFSSIPEISSAEVYALADFSLKETPEKSIFISCLELNRPFLPVMSPEDMSILQRVVTKATDLLWLTGAATLDGKSPDLTLSSGLSRALMLEQPALRFAVLDIGSLSNDQSSSGDNQIHRFVAQALLNSDIPDDKEFVQSHGLLHVSRFVPDNGLNTYFSQRRTQTPVATTFEEASPAQLAIEKVGLMDTIYFQQQIEAKSSPPAGFVDVDVKTISLNAKVSPFIYLQTSTKSGDRIYMFFLEKLKHVQERLRSSLAALSKQ